MTITKLSDTDYRGLNRYSNSDLSEFKRLLIGDNRPLPKNAFHFGSVFHQMILEPEKISGDTWISFTDEQQEKLFMMHNRVTEHKTVQKFLSSKRREEVHLFEAEGLECKSKLDLIANNLIVDFKTTSAKDYQAFVASILKYDYHRQAAFYTDSAQAEGFAFIGVQKQAPFDIFYVELTLWQGPGGLDSGRHQYQSLLRQIKSSKFTPSSWAVPA
jgi:hypothetical protein